MNHGLGHLRGAVGSSDNSSGADDGPSAVVFTEEAKGNLVWKLLDADIASAHNVR